MKNKTLIFIPYQDTDNFYSDGILTREYAMLYMLWDIGYKRVLNIKKPRTWLDKKIYKIHDEYYPIGTKEYQVKQILDKSETIQKIQPFSIRQILEKRGWWKFGYDKYKKEITFRNDDEYIVYSDNPYAVELLLYLKKKGCKVYFDIMDNFAIHPSLKSGEKKIALECYKKIFTVADYITANSKQTCEFMQNYADKEIRLVKNGVFADNEANNALDIKEVRTIRKFKKDYKSCVGYIGKLGLRMDEKLIDSITKQCEDTLFVFVGGYLKGQINEHLIDIFKKRKNVLHIDAVPSAYVYPILDEFDILMIPHSVGKNENGGDPLKLYQYLTRNKPIITTSILGVDEFSDYITITNDFNQWVEFINSSKYIRKPQEELSITWQARMGSLIEVL